MRLTPTMRRVGLPSTRALVENLCKGKSFTEEPSWQRRRKQKRRNTNRRRDDTSHSPRIFTGLLREAPLKGLFLFSRELLRQPTQLFCSSTPVVRSIRNFPCKNWRSYDATGSY